jgi:hypothetical protein
MLATRVDRFQRRIRPAAALAGLGLLAAGCTGGDPHAGLEPVFCYQTLADVACYTRPDRGREGQLVGIYLRDLEVPRAVDVQPAGPEPPRAPGASGGWVRRWLSASVDLAARILSPVGSIVGLFQDP